MGRFTSADPATGWPSDPQSWNMYAYGRNSPLVYVDPTGMNYVVCDANGENCRHFDDDTWKDFAKENNVRTSASGDLYVVNDDGSTTTIGTASYYDEKPMLALQEAGNRAARDITTFAIAEGVFATAYISTYAVPAVVAGLAAMGETGAVGPGVGLLNKIHHIFGNAGHNLGPLVQQYGSPAAAYAALEKATVAHVTARGLTGVFEEVVTVGGTNVTVRGAVVNGVVKIGTAFR